MEDEFCCRGGGGGGGGGKSDVVGVGCIFISLFVTKFSRVVVYPDNGRIPRDNGDILPQADVSVSLFCSVDKIAFLSKCFDGLLYLFECKIS